MLAALEVASTCPVRRTPFYGRESISTRPLKKAGRMGTRRNRTRPVDSFSEGQRINKALWSLAGEFENN